LEQTDTEVTSGSEWFNTDLERSMAIACCAGSITHTHTHTHTHAHAHAHAHAQAI